MIGDLQRGNLPPPVAPRVPAHSRAARPPITEREWQRQVVDLARMLGWTCYHTQLSKWSESGWPDLALVRPPRLVLAELKSEKGKVTDAQRRWLLLLDECDGVEVHVWRPSDLERVAEVLR